jgi:hypothetical protein
MYCSAKCYTFYTPSLYTARMTGPLTFLVRYSMKLKRTLYVFWFIYIWSICTFYTIANTVSQSAGIALSNPPHTRLGEPQSSQISIISGQGVNTTIASAWEVGGCVGASVGVWGGSVGENFHRSGLRRRILTRTRSLACAHTMRIIFIPSTRLPRKNVVWSPKNSISEEQDIILHGRLDQFPICFIFLSIGTF